MLDFYNWAHAEAAVKVEVVAVEEAVRAHVPHVVVVVRISRARPDKPKMKPTGTLIVFPYIILLLVNTIYL